MQRRHELCRHPVSFDFNATCNGVPGMDRVALSMPYSSPPIGGLVPAFPDKLEAAACMPPSSSEE